MLELSKFLNADEWVRVHVFDGIDKLVNVACVFEFDITYLLRRNKQIYSAPHMCLCQ